MLGSQGLLVWGEAGGADSWYGAWGSPPPNLLGDAGPWRPLSGQESPCHRWLDGWMASRFPLRASGLKE